MKYHRAPFDLNFGERPGSVTEIPQAGVGTAETHRPFPHLANNTKQVEVLLGEVMALSFHHLAPMDSQIV